eukprot:Rhum_TRINITY_DN14698_c11_g2::Rhum_TRINITY_DN14698_c11_g2_i1::g.110054::m.110054
MEGRLRQGVVSSALRRACLIPVSVFARILMHWSLHARRVERTPEVASLLHRLPDLQLAELELTRLLVATVAVHGVALPGVVVRPQGKAVTAGVVDAQDVVGGHGLGQRVVLHQVVALEAQRAADVKAAQLVCAGVDATVGAQCREALAPHVRHIRLAQELVRPDVRDGDRALRVPRGTLDCGDPREGDAGLRHDAPAELGHDTVLAREQIGDGLVEHLAVVTEAVCLVVLKVARGHAAADVDHLDHRALRLQLLHELQDRRGTVLQHREGASLRADVDVHALKPRVLLVQGKERLLRLRHKGQAELRATSGGRHHADAALARDGVDAEADAARQVHVRVLLDKLLDVLHLGLVVQVDVHLLQLHESVVQVRLRLARRVEDDVRRTALDAVRHLAERRALQAHAVGNHTLHEAGGGVGLHSDGVLEELLGEGGLQLHKTGVEGIHVVQVAVRSDFLASGQESLGNRSLDDGGHLLRPAGQIGIRNSHCCSGLGTRRVSMKYRYCS